MASPDRPARRVHIGLPGVETWIGRDPDWSQPDEVAAVVADSGTDDEMVSCLAQAVLQVLDEPPSRGGLTVLPARIAVWIPPLWVDGLDDDQQAGVRADLADEPAAVVCRVGLWWRFGSRS